MRHTIAVYSATSKFVDRDLSAALCDQLDAQFETIWLFSRTVPKMFVGRTVHRLPGLSWVRFRVWLYLFELEKYAYRSPIFGRDQPLPHLGLSAFSRGVLAFVLRARLSWLVRKMSIAVLRATVPTFPAPLNRVDACVCFTAPNDPVFDDLVRYYKRRKTLVIIVPLNWDNASSKPYLEAPDLILTWGAQTAELSRQLHGIESLALGSPRFDVSRVPPAPSCAEAKARLGLNPDLNYMLFAGAGFPFDEAGALNRLSAHLVSQSLLNYRIIYRPHPIAWSRAHESDPSEHSQTFVCADPTAGLFEDDDLRLYQFLFKSVVGLITPYSTMLVEAALYGLPALALGYNSQRHPEFDWSANSTHQPHLRFTKTARWIVECRDEARLTGAFGDFLALLEDDAIRDEARRESDRLIRVANYGEELTQAVRRAVSEARRTDRSQAALA